MRVGTPDSELPVLLVALVLNVVTVGPSVQRPTSTPEPDLTLMVGWWTAGPPPLRIEEASGGPLTTSDDRVLLQRALRSGRVEFRGGDGRADPSRSPRRMIVVLGHSLMGPVELPQPTVTALYVQEADTFRRYPAPARVLDRVVRFSVIDGQPDRVLYRIQSASGRRYGGSIWVKDPPTAEDDRPFAGGILQPGVLTRARKIKDSAPVYPFQARTAGIVGRVVVEFTIDPTGKVTGTKILRSDSSLLNQAAIDCVKRWEFAPADMEGEPVPEMRLAVIRFPPRKIDRRQARAAHRLSIKPGALRFGEVIKAVLAQQLIQPSIEEVTRDR
jgi:TonB family protein